MSEPASAPEWARAGDTFRFTWRPLALGAEVGALRESSDGLHAEVTWYGLRPQGDALVPNGHLHGPARLNLVSTSAHQTLARYLSGRAATTPWPQVIEQLCAITVREWRRGEPPVDLGAVPPAPPRRYLVPWLLPEGELTLLYAHGGSGKSLVALLLCLAVRLGLALPGLEPARPVPAVAYCDWETHAQAHARRLQRLARGFGVSPPPGLHYFRMARPLVAEAERLRAECARLGVGLLVVDSAGFAADGDLCEARPAMELMRALRPLGCTTLVLHHLSKSEARQEVGRADPYGTAYWHNGARNAWELRSLRVPRGLRLALYHRKDNDDQLRGQPLGWELAWADDACRVSGFAVREEQALAAYQGVAYVLGELLRHELLTVDELAERTGFPRETVARTLRRDRRFHVADPGGGRGHPARWGLAVTVREWEEVPF